MKCPKCNGSGKSSIPVALNPFTGAGEFYPDCHKCHGTGVIGEQTNEEWLRNASTEELAKFIIHIVEFGMPHELYEAIGHDKNKVIEWLKEKHE